MERIVDVVVVVDVDVDVVVIVDDLVGVIGDVDLDVDGLLTRSKRRLFYAYDSRNRGEPQQDAQGAAA
jgi:hypothetical protein